MKIFANIFATMRNLFLFLTLSISLPVLAQQYFVWDGSSLGPLSNPEAITCDHWAIWVFGDNVSPVPGKQWGEIDGKSPGEVQNKWEAEMKFEQRWKKFSDIQSDPFGCENHLGPIAVVKQPRLASDSHFGDTSQKQQDLCDRIIKDFGRAKKLMDAYDKYIKDSPSGGYYTAGQQEKSQLRQFLDNLLRITKNANKFRHQLNGFDGVYLSQISDQLNGMNAELDSVEASGQQLEQKLNNQSNGDGASDWLGQTGYEKSGSGISTKVTAFDGLQTGFTVTVVGHGGFNNYNVLYRNISNVQMASQDNQVILVLTTAPYSIYVSFPTAAQAQHFYEFIRQHRS